MLVQVPVVTDWHLDEMWDVLPSSPIAYSGHHMVCINTASQSGCHVGGFLGEEHLDRYPKPRTHCWRYYLVEISLVMPNLLCPSYCIFLLELCMVC